MSACRRKYAALGMVGRPQVFCANAQAAVRFPTNGAGGGPFLTTPYARSSVSGPPWAAPGTKGGARLRTIPVIVRCPWPARTPAAPRGAGRSSAEKPSVEQGIFLVVLERDPLDALLFLEVRQLDAS